MARGEEKPKHTGSTEGFRDKSLPGINEGVANKKCNFMADLKISTMRQEVVLGDMAGGFKNGHVGGRGETSWQVSKLINSVIPDGIPTHPRVLHQFPQS